MATLREVAIVYDITGKLRFCFCMDDDMHYLGAYLSPEMQKEVDAAIEASGLPHQSREESDRKAAESIEAYKLSQEVVKELLDLESVEHLEVEDESEEGEEWKKS